MEGKYYPPMNYLIVEEAAPLLLDLISQIPPPEVLPDDMSLSVLKEEYVKAKGSLSSLARRKCTKEPELDLSTLRQTALEELENKYGERIMAWEGRFPGAHPSITTSCTGDIFGLVG
jgi:hypothetical protein